MNSLYCHFKIFRSICHLSPLNSVVPIKIILGRVTKNGFEVSIHFLVVVCFGEERPFFTRNVQKNKKRRLKKLIKFEESKNVETHDIQNNKKRRFLTKKLINFGESENV